MVFKVFLCFRLIVLFHPINKYHTFDLCCIFSWILAKNHKVQFGHSLCRVLFSRGIVIVVLADSYLNWVACVCEFSLIFCANYTNSSKVYFIEQILFRKRTSTSQTQSTTAEKLRAEEKRTNQNAITTTITAADKKVYVHICVRHCHMLSISKLHTILSLSLSRTHYFALSNGVLGWSVFFPCVSFNRAFWH